MVFLWFSYFCFFCSDPKICQVAAEDFVDRRNYIQLVGCGWPPCVFRGFKGFNSRIIDLYIYILHKYIYTLHIHTYIHIYIYMIVSPSKKKSSSLLVVLFVRRYRNRYLTHHGDLTMFQTWTGFNQTHWDSQIVRWWFDSVCTWLLYSDNSSWYGDLASKDTLWLFNIAIENGPFIDDFPIETSIYEGFSMAMLNHQMVGQSLPG